MVYTEYFAAGTEPIGFCTMHQAQGIVGQIADGFSSPQPRVDDVLPPPVPVGIGTSGTMPIGRPPLGRPVQAPPPRIGWPRPSIPTAPGTTGTTAIGRSVQAPPPRTEPPRPPPIPTGAGTTGTTSIGRIEKPAASDKPATPRADEPARAPSIPSATGIGDDPPLPNAGNPEIKRSRWFVRMFGLGRNDRTKTATGVSGSQKKDE